MLNQNVGQSAQTFDSLTPRSPRISVIMNCLNCSKYLKEAIDSVYAQTYKDWEIIFWDNASTDNSAKIAKSYCEKLRYFRSEKTVPLGQTRNCAIEKANGEFIAFLDCDDLWLHDKLEKQVKIINEEKDSNLGIVYGRVLYFKENGEKGELVKNYAGKRLPEGYILDELILKENFIPLLSAIVLKEAYIDMGGIPQDFEYAEDYYLFAAISSRYKVRAVQEVCCMYRMHTANASLNQKTIMYEECLKVVLKWSPFLKKEVSEKLYKKRIKTINSMAGAMMICYGRKYKKGLNRIIEDGSVWILFQYFLEKILMRALKWCYHPSKNSD